MANTYKILGQSAPSATTNTDVYTVPSATQTVISTITITNRSASVRSYRIAMIPSGATLANEHYITYDVALAANDATTLTLGISLGAGDKVTVYASSADLSFGIFGAEIS